MIGQRSHGSDIFYITPMAGALQLLDVAPREVTASISDESVRMASEEDDLAYYQIRGKVKLNKVICLFLPVFRFFQGWHRHTIAQAVSVP